MGFFKHLNEKENDIFLLIPRREKDYYLTKDEELAMRSLENGRNNIIKWGDKGSAIVVWDSMFEGLKKKRITTEKKKNYFKLNFEKTANVGKLYLLLNINKRFSNLLGHTVILSFGTFTEIFSEFLDHHLQPVMKEEKYST